MNLEFDKYDLRECCGRFTRRNLIMHAFLSLWIWHYGLREFYTRLTRIFALEWDASLPWSYDNLFNLILQIVPCKYWFVLQYIFLAKNNWFSMPPSIRFTINTVSYLFRNVSWGYFQNTEQRLGSQKNTKVQGYLPD